METLREFIERRIAETGAPTHYYRALNRLWTRATAAKLVDPSRGWKSPYRSARDMGKVAAELELLWRRRPKGVAATITEYLEEKLAQAAATAEPCLLRFPEGETDGE